MSPSLITCASRFSRRFHNLLGPSAVVLMYHRVADVSEADDPQGLCISPALFEQHIASIARAYPTPPLNEAVDALSGTSHIMPSSICISFDDGYQDNVTVALPILEHYNVPAAFFIATERLDNSRPFYWDELAGLSLEASAYWEAVDRLQKLSPKMRRGALDAIERNDTRSEKNMDLAPHVTSALISEIASNPLVTIGAHTHRHAYLASLAPNEQREEIMTSKSILDNLCPRPIELFAYPYGTPGSFTKQTEDLVAQAGFKAAFSTTTEQLRRGRNHMALGRLGVKNTESSASLDRRIKEVFGR